MKDVFLFDTLSGKKLKLVTRRPQEVRIYGCGPTVYGFTHVGNARAFLVQDLVVRVLEMAGYRVDWARNYTDIDDKIIDRAKAENKSSLEIAETYSRAFDEDMKRLKIRTPHHCPRATQTIPEILQMIQGLIEKGFAYQAKGDVYFRVSKLPGYGKLSRRKLEDMVAGFRIEPGELKESPADFALWKSAKPQEPSWKSPWGEGRPGWHIECSAMIHQIFPEGLDIHMGGLDLIFPHHENEIAQSEAYTGRALANYWLHNGMLEIGKEKMSKSLGNLITISEFCRLYGPETLRLMTAQVHYRSPLDFSDENILRAEALMNRIYQAKMRLEEGASEISSLPLPAELENLESRIQSALCDDFNAPKALGFALSSLRACMRTNTPSLWPAWRPALIFLQNILAIGLDEPSIALKEARKRKLDRVGMTEVEAQDIEKRLEEREELRAQKKFKESDAIRIELENRGLQIMDGPDGSTWNVK